MLSNNQLQQAVRDELSFDPSFADSEIVVTATEGTVSLAGYVPSYAEKRFAGRAAQRVAGVRKFTDDLKVRIPSDITLSDQEITTRAAQSLAWDVSVPSQVKATAADGVVTLTGEADYRFEKAAAELNVARLQGVTGITNEIALKPTTPTAPHFPADITKALDRFAFEGANMTVTAEGGKVLLKGTVANAHQRELAEHAAWSAPGVTQVDDRLSIN